MTYRIRNSSPQSKLIYHLLLREGQMTAKQIGLKLGIFPNAVYRSCKPLLDLGVLEQLDTYPIEFQSISTPIAKDWYMRLAAQSFQHDFSSKDQQSTDPSLPTITFIKNRSHLLRMTEYEARRAIKTFNYIVSGHKIPDSTVLSIRKATTSGVKVRAIIQNTPQTANYPLENYSYMGTEVKYLPNIGIRMFIFDSSTAIITSYDEEQSSRAFGIRFTYAPVAKQLNQLFEQRWQEAVPIDT